MTKHELETTPIIELEKIFNKISETCDVSWHDKPSYIRMAYCDHIAKQFPDLGFRVYDASSFVIEHYYDHIPFKNIEHFDVGYVQLCFSASAKKTDETTGRSKVSQHYVYTGKNNPIKFGFCYPHIYTASFAFMNKDDPDDFSLYTGGGNDGGTPDPEWTKDKNMCIRDVINKNKEVYQARYLYRIKLEFYQMFYCWAKNVEQKRLNFISKFPADIQVKLSAKPLPDINDDTIWQAVVDWVEANDLIKKKELSTCVESQVGS